MPPPTAHAPALPDPVFEVRDLSVHAGPAEIAAHVSLTLRPGRMTALVGESGCGKSLTAAALGDLLPAGLASTAAAPSALRAGPHGLAYVFQDPGVHLNPVLTVRAQIAEALAAAGVPRAARKARILDLLERVGLPDSPRVAASYPHQLSGGMQQRAMIAMALALSPRVLVADEPTTALDVTVQARILDLLRHLQVTENLAVLLITHNLGVVAQVADDMAVMYAGRIVEQGPVPLVLRQAAHPYVHALLRALPTLRGTAPGALLQEIPGRVPPPGSRPPGCRFAPRCPAATPECSAAEPPLAAIHPGAVPPHLAACLHPMP